MKHLALMLNPGQPRIHQANMTRTLRTLAFLAGLTRAANIPQRPLGGSKLTGPLRFNSDGTFQISVLQDLHFGESQSPERDQEEWSTNAL